MEHTACAFKSCGIVSWYRYTSV